MDGAFRVGSWLVEPQLNLIADGQRTIHLEPKVMKVLVQLAEHADKVISKERLIHAVWPDTFVTDDVLTHAVAELRRAFGDDARAPCYIQTIPKGGYRLIAPLIKGDIPHKDVSGSSAGVVAEKVPTPLIRSRVALVAGLALLLVAAGGLLWPRRIRPSGASTMHLAVTIPPAGALVSSRGGHLPAFDLSADGTRLVYEANSEYAPRLYLRALDEREARPLSGTEGGSQPFFSPGGESIGFTAQGRLKTASLVDGSVVDVCDAPTLRGGAFTTRGTIVFAPSHDGALWQVSTAGGPPTQLTRLDVGEGENSHRWPDVLPDGKTVLFTIRRGGHFEDARVAVVDIETGERRGLLEGGTFARYASSGHLVYGRGAAMLAAPFDPIRLRVAGAPVRILDGLMPYRDTGAADISMSRSGSVAYIVQGAGVNDRTLVWVDERGLTQPVLQARRGYEAPRLSRDGRRIAVTIVEGSDSGIWVVDLARGALSRVTSQSGNTNSIWHPTGRSVTFSSSRNGPSNIFSQPADATHGPERLTRSSYWQVPTSWSPDGRLLAYTELHALTGPDIWILERDSGRRRPFAVTSALEKEAAFSPDGLWLAYVSDESGTLEVYLGSPQEPKSKWQISTDGGNEPVWDPRGGTLFYRSGDKMMAVAVTTHPRFSAAKPRMLFEGRYRGFPWWVQASSYDVTPAGNRFLMIKEGDRATPPSEINIILNWFDELGRRAPAPN